MRNHGMVVALLLCLVAGFVHPVDSKLSERKFNELLSKFKKHNEVMDRDQYHLLFKKISTLVWNSPESVGMATGDFANKTYNVVVYYVPPFVEFEDRDALDGDPGNVMQTRTIENGGLSGLTIDFLALVEEVMGMKFNFYYPCETIFYQDNGFCNDNTLRSAEAAKGMLDVMGANSTLFYGGGTGLCGPEFLCLSAGGHKISEDLLLRYFVSQPYMEKGFRMVVKTETPEPDFMSWAQPFDFRLWILVVVEIGIVGVAFMFVEGYGTNEMLSTNPIGLIFDTFYWSLTLILGIADKQPSTHAGRTLVMAQLFFTLLLVAVYTGNINSFLLNVPTVTKIARFDDLINTESDLYNSNNVVCVARNQPSIKSFLDLQLGLDQSLTVQTVETDDISECMQLVYNGEADATFYDEPIVKFRVAGFYKNGKCGDNGGYCTDTTIYDKDECECPQRDADRNCLQTDNKWTSVTGSLVTTGEVFNPFGYALIFPRAEQVPAKHIGFSQAVQYIKENGEITKLDNKWIPPSADLECASTDVAAITLRLVNIQGLITITAGIAVIGLVVGCLELFIAFFVRVCPCKGCCAKLEEMINSNAEEAKHQHELRDQQKHHEAAEKAKQAEMIAEEKKDGLFDNGNGTNGVLPPPPQLPPPFPDLPVTEAVLELETRMDRIEDMLQRASERCERAMAMENAAKKKAARAAAAAARARTAHVAHR
mmetsp:Transcript_3247/g.7708  ORF Transcript_3247/g.7708 Transcript_3247/m.7708 type:complete len:709 (+) Transcript_3247:213-2339(+)